MHFFDPEIFRVEVVVLLLAALTGYRCDLRGNVHGILRNEHASARLGSC